MVIFWQYLKRRAIKTLRKISNYLKNSGFVRGSLCLFDKKLVIFDYCVKLEMMLYLRGG